MKVITQIKEFGLGFAIKYDVYSVLSKISKRYIAKRNKLVSKWLDKHYQYAISNVVASANDIETTNENYIWVLWWQGLQNAPEIVKKCVNNLQNNAKGKVVVITKDNFSQYAKVPDYILKKLEQKKITVTHFSDILRMCLLAEHGGLWTDATIFAYNTDLSEYLSKDFYTIKKLAPTDNVSQNRWSGYFLKTNKNNELILAVRNLFFEYWKKHNMLITYFLIDHSINLVYNKNQNVKQMIDDVPTSNPNIEKLPAIFGQPYNEEKFKQLTKDTCIFKLNWRATYPTSVDGKPTFYEKFLNAKEIVNGK